MEKIRKKNNIDVLLASILIAIMPVLAPYSIFGVSVIWSLGLLYIFYVIVFVDHGKLHIDKKIISYFSFPIITIIISLNGLFILNNVNNLLHQLIGLLLSIILIYFIWMKSDYHLVVKAGNIIAYICGIYAVIQLIIILRGGLVPSGKIPFLQLTEGQGWVPETWGFRINSLFSEPSYFAIYLLPLFAASFNELKYKNTLIFAFLIILSSSSLGIISMIFIIVWQIVFSKKTWKYKVGGLLCILAIICILMFIITNNDSLNTIFNRTINKVYSINSDDIRLTGYINYFSYYDTKEMLLGVGTAQFQNYFAERNINLANYSNSIVMIILQYGLIGFILAIIYYIYIAKESIKRKSMIFYWILIIAMATDYLSFSYRYYYLLYFVLFFVQNCENEKRENTKKLKS